MAQQSLVVRDLLIIEASRSHSGTPHSVILLCTSDQPVAKTYLTTQTFMLLAEFEPAIPSEWSQTHALDRAVTGMGSWPV
jgi:hypothetical protein